MEYGFLILYARCDVTHTRLRVSGTHPSSVCLCKLTRARASLGRTLESMVFSRNTKQLTFGRLRSPDQSANQLESNNQRSSSTSPGLSPRWYNHYKNPRNSIPSPPHWASYHGGNKYMGGSRPHSVIGVLLVLGNLHDAASLAGGLGVPTVGTGHNGGLELLGRRATRLAARLLPLLRGGVLGRAIRPTVAQPATLQADSILLALSHDIGAYPLNRLISEKGRLQGLF
jgi:hypothetical protein